MKLDEQAKDGKDFRELGKEIPKDAGKEKAGAKGAKDPTKAGAMVERTASGNTTVNGVEGLKDSSQQREKGKTNEIGGMISPESLEAH